MLTEGTNKIAEFLASADLYLLRKQRNMAGFMLHRAGEQALHTMFLITTGMYLNTHSIGNLLRYCSMVYYRLPDIFPGNNEKNERLFRLLQKAYTGRRYDIDYSIGMQDLEVLKKRVEELKGLSDRL
ncbi:HEPN domain-containing protein [Ginsengibacter hankyongi]|uniref:HEPN domain-containing protein n=1 Tax=Ginsengibacter hankyongi TaxID=2607284 RepID=A0A5J5ICW9_9BACT|nr:HEPN domain-containing protein [Ginsengibacter hankyongi]KAA9036120.1 HEPN domain-containing protein [Ginsengibacter hankyongi]